MTALHKRDTRYRPRTLVGAVALFLLLDFSILALNYRISWDVDRDSVAINLAGRQRMLSQRITKSLLLMRAAETTIDREQARSAFINSFTLFGSTLEAFDRGGKATGGDGRDVLLKAVKGEARKTITAALARWHPLSLTLAPAANPGSNGGEDAIRAAIGQRDEMLDLMNRLTSQMEADSMARTARLRQIQGVAFALAFFNFLAILRMLHNRYCALLDHQRELNSMLEEIGAGVVLLDAEKRIQRANTAAARLLGQSADALTGRRINELLSPQDDCWHGIRSDGSEFHAELVPGRIDGACGPLDLLTLLDVTTRHQQQERFEKMAKLDALTGLPNRRALEERLQRALARAKRSGDPLGVALVDLDHFKAVNDTYGHAAGDALLQAVARRAGTSLRTGDTFARIGGDEFVALIGPARDATEIRTALERLHSGLTEPFDLGVCTLGQQFSIGLAIYPDDADTADALLHHADLSMYGGRSKRRTSSEAPKPATPPAAG